MMMNPTSLEAESAVVRADVPRLISPRSTQFEPTTFFLEVDIPQELSYEHSE
jgi:hypothetical protein